jgi:hypothetical protein
MAGSRRAIAGSGREKHWVSPAADRTSTTGNVTDGPIPPCALVDWGPHHYRLIERDWGNNGADFGLILGLWRHFVKAKGNCCRIFLVGSD